MEQTKLGLAKANIGVAHQDKNQLKFGRLRRCLSGSNIKEKRMNKFESITKPMMWSTTVLLAAILAACGGGGSTPAIGPAPSGATCTGTGCVDLGSAANYVILAKAGITYTPAATVTSTAKITGNMGVSPAAAGTITGFALDFPAGAAYATSKLVNGVVYAPGYAPPTPASLTTAVGAMETAYTTANGGAAGAACPGTGNFGGLIITAGVYDCAIPVGIATSMTLDGPGVFVFRITGTLTQANATQVNLTGGAVAQNVFWVVSQGVDIGTTSTMNGVILGKTLINLKTGATANGRLLAQTSVTMDANTVTQP